MTSITIVVPALNEGTRIKKNLHAIIDYLQKKDYDYEIIVIDDGSTDNTSKQVTSLTHKHITLLQHKPNRGKGYSVKQGILAAAKDLVLFTDSDLSTPIQELENLIQHIPDYDIVIASRAIKGKHIQKQQPFHRVFIGKCFNMLVQLLSVPGIKDTQCGFKLFKTHIAKQIFNKLTIDRWAFDVEALFIARIYGYSIKETPVTWHASNKTEIHAIRDSLQMLRDILRIRLNNIKGAYKR